MKVDKHTDRPKHDLVCQRCDHRWDYAGNNPFFTLCPRCRTTVRTKKNNVKSLQSERGYQPTQTAAAENPPAGADEIRQ